MNTPYTVVLKILDKEYQVACTPEEEAGLMMAAKYLDKQMRSIKTSGKVIGLERIAIMAALNISYELLNDDKESNELPEKAADQISSLDKTVEDALHRMRQLEIG